MKTVIECVAHAVEVFCKTQDGAHDWWHIDRVRRNALAIAALEGGDLVIIELAALVHDVGDHKAHESEEIGRSVVEHLLEECLVPQPLLQRVLDIALHVSFRGAGVPDVILSLEGQIVQDADRLDAMGAIAIARTFTWGGARGRPIYDPDQKVCLASTPEEYYAGGGSSIAHFHEKLLLLSKRLHTRTAKQVGLLRHEFMLTFLAQFQKEWEGIPKV